MEKGGKTLGREGRVAGVPSSQKENSIRGRGPATLAALLGGGNTSARRKIKIGRNLRKSKSDLQRAESDKPDKQGEAPGKNMT